MNKDINVKLNGKLVLREDFGFTPLKDDDELFFDNPNKAETSGNGTGSDLQMSIADKMLPA